MNFDDRRTFFEAKLRGFASTSQTASRRFEKATNRGFKAIKVARALRTRSQKKRVPTVVCARACSSDPSFASENDARRRAARQLARSCAGR